MTLLRPPKKPTAWLIVLLITSAPPALAFNRETCYASIVQQLSNGTLRPDSDLFYRSGNGAPMSTPSNPVLTLPGCRALCGGTNWYVDIGPRLSTWLIPVLLLISNMDVSPLDKRRYLMLLHLLGDPIDSLWSLLVKVEAWSRCYASATGKRSRVGARGTRDVATVLGALEEVLEPGAHPGEFFDALVGAGRRRRRRRLTPGAYERLLSSTACELADSRTDELLRTFFAVALYLYQLVAAFVTVVGGGNTSPPGGRIGTAMFMTWLVPAILVSNAVSGFASRRTCFRVLDRFVRDLADGDGLLAKLREASPQSKRYRNLREYHDAQSWSGAVYTYRPEKQRLFRGGPTDYSLGLLLLLAVLPVFISTVVSTIILWDTPPVGINCRNFMVFGISLAWFLSPFITWLIYYTGLVTSKAHWYITIVKDTIIAIPSIVLIFLSSCGLFNSCWCWSGVYSLHDRAHVPLNVADQFQHNDRTIYPTLVGTCLALQFCVFAGMMWVGRRGLRFMRWSEAERQEECDRSR